MTKNIEYGMTPIVEQAYDDAQVNFITASKEDPIIRGTYIGAGLARQIIRKLSEEFEHERRYLNSKHGKKDNEIDVLDIVDQCFHAYASDYRNDAREMALDLIK